MAYESLSLSELIPATGEQIYSAWLSSEHHTAFTGDQATIEPVVGGRHSAFSGYARGSIVALEPGTRIVKTWRTTDFPEGSPDSRVELTLEETVGGTMITLLHTEIPEGQSDSYRDGWVKYYFEPLKNYFRDAKAHIEIEGVPGTVSNGAVTGMTTRARIAPAAPKPPAKAKPKLTAKAKSKPAKRVKPAKSAKSKKTARAARTTPKKTKAKTKRAAKAKPKAAAKAKSARKSPRSTRKQGRATKKR